MLAHRSQGECAVPKKSQLHDEHAPLNLSLNSVKQSLTDHLIFSIGKDPITATERDWFFTLANVVRDRLIEGWMETMRRYYNHDAKRVYYLSMEFLIGRSLMNSVLNIGFIDEVRRACIDAGVQLDKVQELEFDAALGNGGLGRLAACFLDSMATIGLPGYGMGIRYEYGMFNQKIESGWQVEHPDNWLRYGNPWEFPRPEVLYPVKFGGRVVEYCDENGRACHHWVDTDEVMAMAYDTPTPGFGAKTVNNMRLWSAKASRDFDLKYFNEGNYIKAVEDKNESENLSKVLYPNDTTAMGRELRLKQQYFFVCASLQDILYRFLKHHDSFDDLPDKVAIQLNDTHPSIAIPEMMRLLMDTYHLDWDHAWSITTRTFAYTNHTLMPEALETWPVSMFEALLPRHLQIIYEINQRFLQDVIHRFPGDTEQLRRMSIIDETHGRRVRMAHLAIVGSHHVNGVAQIHSELMKATIFADFERCYPGKLINITNGITPRLWLNQANPRLAQLITNRIGKGWITDLAQLRKLAPLADDPVFQAEFLAVKRANKEKLAAILANKLKLEVSPDSLFDIQVKRIHEYKRQLLNVLHVITLYNRIRSNPGLEVVPRTVIIAGKAAPGYAMAKLTIKLINDAADIINNDPATRGLLKLAFLPNYDVSSASEIIPAADLSEQISTAGTEASGTGNMKLALNGALTIGTLDGANIEIMEEVGRDNIFIFGLSTEEVTNLRNSGYDPWGHYHGNEELKWALDMIASGYFSPDQADRFQPIVHALTRSGDRYLLLADYAAYIAAQEQVDALYRDPQQWTRRAIFNVAGMGKFSSDRTIGEYAEKIWDAKPVL
ncbi:MAG: glycogen/starch/alpha-glucan phosphorylase [Gammaproteobacteria bacterium]|nr:glycogen/starch/alpha-glucan phosphorylase [Gammaproteobacteria bacterium]MBU1731826.1 glycogen/starch/alpha-glucan phosphorylase [Gammaproteobacteria bacterium]MBU1892437.1 glycogen/starch/alpha-glucan phosphorylase [Gammaproteobacteria bacterium]